MAISFLRVIPRDPVLAGPVRQPGRKRLSAVGEPVTKHFSALRRWFTIDLRQ
ncbi:hypothetical protein [Amycolatopsis sp. DG1A-15b]|uniref:hypothetical protein n=1 Tax=Amycolatopsis sp. DG1A-15b TaxID=3052846 RepID=UPI00255BD83F|nr:hypothetical protein [Amycolatopsis sp. DG1A-15b]WIX91398.1 hypothetical protein QRY02_13595 [Amycolatopsis sp. DG1A-15b]